jgi:hypothetical protein
VAPASRIASQYSILGDEEARHFEVLMVWVVVDAQVRAMVRKLDEVDRESGMWNGSK